MANPGLLVSGVTATRGLLLAAMREKVENNFALFCLKQVTDVWIVYLLGRPG